MKVIRNTHAGWSRREGCGKCKSVVEVEGRDLYAQYNRGLAGSFWDPYDYGWTCPVCWATNWFRDLWNVPQHIRTPIEAEADLMLKESMAARRRLTRWQRLRIWAYETWTKKDMLGQEERVLFPVTK